MNHEQRSDIENKKPRVQKLPERRKKGDKTQTGVRLGHELFNEILDIAESSHLSFADAMRLLLHIGKDQYKLNGKAGITTKAKRRQHKAKQEAEAEAQALAAQRESRKQARNKKGGKDAVIPAVSVILAGEEPEDD